MVASLVRAHLTTDQQRHLEEQLIEALTCWLNKGTMSHAEAGAIISELATLYLKHHHLLDAAELLIRYGWLSFNQGHAPHLAQLAMKILQEFDWHGNEENECGGLILQHFLPPFVGKPIDSKQRFRDYQRIRDAVLTERIVVQPPTEVFITHHTMMYTLSILHFSEAQALIDTCCVRLEPLQMKNPDLQASLLEKRAWLFTTLSEYTEEVGDIQKAKTLREQAIAIYRQSEALISTYEEPSPLKKRFLKKRLARTLNNLSYHLNRSKQHKEALQVIEHSITLKEEGYVEFDTLADAYGEKAEALMGLGRFQEALHFDEKAMAEVERLAKSGHTLSQKEVWIYRVNRGRLYLRMGKIDEAEQLLREALPHIHSGRRMYRMFAEDALREIEQSRRSMLSPQHQLDWRWVERYRELDAFDSYWWLASAGPFNREEQQKWDEIFTPKPDEATKECLGGIIAQSRQRELAAAITEQREPRLHYPALDIEEVHHRITGLLQLDAHIQKDDPNAIVRRLYHGAIEEEVNYLYLIEATYEGNTEQFWKCNLSLVPSPTSEEMAYALSRVRQTLLQGFMRAETRDISQCVVEFIREHLDLSLDLSSDEEKIQELQKEPLLSSSQQQRTVTPQTAKRFFEAVLKESNYIGWQVEIDPNAVSPRVEQGLRRLFLPNNKLSIGRIRNYLSHELASHAARCVAGERSPLGLLGINTKNSLETEEGLAIYYERQTANLYGQAYDDSGSWLGTLAIGLATGISTPAQTFSQLFAFFEPFLLLYRLVRRRDEDMQKAQQQAHKRALERCLRTYRGVPDLEKAGVCFTKDALYLRGLWKIEQALAQDKTVLDRLAVGVVALEQFPDLQELGIVSSPQSLRKFISDPNLEAYILSFEQLEEKRNKPA